MNQLIYNIHQISLKSAIGWAGLVPGILPLLVPTLLHHPGYTLPSTAPVLGTDVAPAVVSEEAVGL